MSGNNTDHEYTLKRMRCPGSIEQRPALQIRRKNASGFSDFVCCLGLVREGAGKQFQYRAARAIILAFEKAEPKS